jgi:Zinc carboxypeptidase
MRRLPVSRKHRQRHRPRITALFAALVVTASLAAAPTARAAGGPAPARGPAAALAPPAPERASVIRLIVPDAATFQRLVASGADLTGHVLRGPDGRVEVDAVATPTEVAALRALGATTASTAESPAQEAQARPAPAAASPSPTGAPDRVTIDRAVWFKTPEGYFISVEASTSAGAVDGLTLTASWTGVGGTSGRAALAPFVDAEVYMGHLLSTPAPATGRPKAVTVTSSQGGRATARVTEWPNGKRPPPAAPGYRKDFVDHYMPPAELYARIAALHKRFPRLTDIIDLPNKTNGYRRNAQTVLGSPPGAAVVVTSKTYGSEGGNDLLVELIDPGSANSPLSVTVDGKLITVRLGTDATGAPVSTAAQVAAALTAEAGSPVTASTYRGDAGAGVMAPAPVTQLSDSLKAPASVPRAPFQVRALRVGVHRDGSRTGVLAYAQEHAREWVTPLVTIEAAERLLRNYGRDPATTRLLRDTDIFIVPSVNPDGANYSFYDFNLQRKNMRNYCPAAQADPGLRNSWGVDINRNYDVGSLFDGYFGASTNCQSGTFAGPAEHSEPESRNVIWLAERYRNIRFAMNVHSFGGYFMWPPGAYKLDGRVTLPRPTPAQLDFFLASAKTIEQGIAAERGTVTWPQQTGPVTDVLYSAAGNSADELWYDLGVFGWDFEVGNSLWNAETKQWEEVGFQPPFEEGHDEAMEYAGGLIAMIGVAAEFEQPAEFEQR